MLARGGHSQAETAVIVGCSKRDVSECASWLRKSGTMLEQLEAMSEAEAAASGGGDDGHLQVEAKSLVERKSRTRACCSSSCGPSAARRGAGRLPFSYSRICEILSEGGGPLGRLVHEPGQKAYVDWAGDVAWPTDRVTGRRTKAYVPAVCPPRSGWIWAGRCADMPTRSWLDGHMRVFGSKLRGRPVLRPRIPRPCRSTCVFSQAPLAVFITV